jgi:hypothetical protein
LATAAASTSTDEDDADDDDWGGGPHEEGLETYGTLNVAMVDRWMV